MNREEALKVMLDGKKVRQEWFARNCFFYYNEEEYSFRYSSFGRKDFPIGKMMPSGAVYEFHIPEVKKITITESQLRASFTGDFIDADEIVKRLFKE